MEIVNFLLDNWQYFSIAVVVILEIILMLIKKRSNTTIVDNGLCDFLSGCILKAEQVYKDGNDKLEYVLQCCKERLGDAYNEEECRFFIEWLLSLPTKKGGIGREED